MEKQLVIAIAMAVPVILVPAAFVWYLTIGGLRAITATAHRTVHGEGFRPIIH